MYLDLSRVQTGKFLAQVFLRQKTGTRKLAQVIRKSILSFVRDMTRVVIRFAKSDLQSIVQSAAEFHDRNLPGIEHVLFLPVSGASFLYQKNGARNPVHTGKFSGARNLR